LEVAQIDDSFLYPIAKFKEKGDLMKNHWVCPTFSSFASAFLPKQSSSQ